MTPRGASAASPFAFQYNFSTEVSTDQFSAGTVNFRPSDLHINYFREQRIGRAAMTRTSTEPTLGQSPLHLFHRAVQVVTEIYQAEMASYDLTARQYAVLFALAHSEGMSQSKLVDATGIDRSTMADIVRRMLKKGIIQRKRDKDDARAYDVKITEEGVRLFKSVTPIIQRIEEKLLSSLSTNRVDEFLNNLGTIVGAATAPAGTVRNGHFAEAEARE
jgi:DNA-binding MarR family transcriptional regulator